MPGQYKAPRRPLGGNMASVEKEVCELMDGTRESNGEHEAVLDARTLRRSGQAKSILETEMVFSKCIKRGHME